jgi:hypothetical protein
MVLVVVELVVITVAVMVVVVVGSRGPKNNGKEVEVQNWFKSISNSESHDFVYRSGMRRPYFTYSTAGRTSIVIWA